MTAVIIGSLILGAIAGAVTAAAILVARHFPRWRP
jgi:hypothetical protein